MVRRYHNMVFLGFWPAPPEQGGLEVYLTGPFARALKARRPDDPWWEALYAYHPRTP